MTIQKRLSKLEDRLGLVPPTDGILRATTEIYDPKTGEILWRKEGDPGGILFHIPDTGRDLDLQCKRQND